MKNILDQWEADIKSREDERLSFLDITIGTSPLKEDELRILALIDLVRKKDEALTKFFNANESDAWTYVAKEALALTEILNA